MFEPSPLDLPSPAPLSPCEVPDDAFAAARFGSDPGDPRGDLAAAWDAHHPACGEFDENWFATTDPLFGDGRRHDPLRAGADQAAGDRRAGAAGALSSSPGLRARRPLRLVAVAGEGAGLRLPVDPQGRHRPLRADTRDGERERARSLLLAARTRHGDLPPRLGRSPDRGEHLSRHREAQPDRLIAPPGGDDDDGAPFLTGLTVAACIGLALWIALGVAVAWAEGRL